MKAGTTLRIARPTDNLAAVAAMYEKGLGFTVLARFQDHDGFDGIVLGHPRQPYHLKDLAAAGTVLMAGRTLNADERTFGIVVFVAESEARAEEFMRNDPSVKHGIMRAELFPYAVALWSRTGPAGGSGGA